MQNKMLITLSAVLFMAGVARSRKRRPTGGAARMFATTKLRHR